MLCGCEQGRCSLELLGRKHSCLFPSLMATALGFRCTSVRPVSCIASTLSFVYPPDFLLLHVYLPMFWVQFYPSFSTSCWYGSCFGVWAWIARMKECSQNPGVRTWAHHLWRLIQSTMEIFKNTLVCYTYCLMLANWVFGRWSTMITMSLRAALSTEWVA